MVDMREAILFIEFLLRAAQIAVGVLDVEACIRVPSAIGIHLQILKRLPYVFHSYKKRPTTSKSLFYL